MGGLDLEITNNTEIKEHLIEVLRGELPVLRTKARVSQEEIAEKIGISRQTYSSIETGKRDMSWTTFLAMMAFFQNNDSTKQMINSIEGLSKGVENFIDSNSNM